MATINSYVSLPEGTMHVGFIYTQPTGLNHTRGDFIHNIHTTWDVPIIHDDVKEIGNTPSIK
jgi:hypothetical protein